MTELSPMQDPLGLQRLGYAASLLEHAAVQWVDGVMVPRAERLIEETPVVLVYNGAAHVVMMTTPEHLEDFGIGFSLTEELIESPGDIRSIEIVRYGQGIEVQMTVPAEVAEKIGGRSRKLSGRTGCGICGSDTIADMLKVRWMSRCFLMRREVASSKIRRTRRSDGSKERAFSPISRLAKSLSVTE